MVNAQLVEIKKELTSNKWTLHPDKSKVVVHSKL
jgi:hypothetical protein